jgi:undecaprenyl-diphosphatase
VTGPQPIAGGTDAMGSPGRPQPATVARTTAALAASAGRMADPERWRWVPPSIALPEDGRLAEFDRTVDDWFASWLRDRPIADAVFYAASAVGDHGLIWLAIAGLQAARRRDANWRRRLLRVAAGLGIESALVNGPVKWMFRRRRPVHDGPRSLYLRQPRTSSFPSGHATAAFFAAALLRDDDPWWPLYYGLAVVVAGSRVHVKIHHASDIVGGAILGTLLGELARQLVPLTPQEPPAPRLTLVADEADDDEAVESPGLQDR